MPADILEQSNDPADDKSGAKNNLDKCPVCEGDFLKRKPRVGFLQRRVFAAFGYFPWRCSRCGGSFMMKMRGLPLRHQERAEESEAEREGSL